MQNMPESLKSEKEAADIQNQFLSNKLAEVETLNRTFVTLLSQFFAFEIEEADLRKAVAKLVPNVDEFIHEPPYRLPVQDPAPTSSNTTAHAQSSRDHKSSNSFPPLEKNQHDQKPTPEPMQKADDIELVLPQLHAGGVPTVAYRIRGKPTHEIKQFIPAGFSKEEEEKKLIEQLNKARKRMQRHIKLQVCLL